MIVFEIVLNAENVRGGQMKMKVTQSISFSTFLVDFDTFHSCFSIC